MLWLNALTTEQVERTHARIAEREARAARTAELTAQIDETLTQCVALSSHPEAEATAAKVRADIRWASVATLERYADALATQLSNLRSM